jgi:fatty acyl-CoA reductase
MVVNAIIVAMVAHANQPSDDHVIYHVGSSVRNPITYRYFKEYNFKYFTEKPWINKDGKPVKVGKVTVFSNLASFKRYMFIRYLLPLKVLNYFKFLISTIHISSKYVSGITLTYSIYMVK